MGDLAIARVSYYRRTPWRIFKKRQSFSSRVPPASLKKKIVEILMRPGTYSLFGKGYALKVPVGNDTWKGQQARIVTLWGEDDTGNPLVVTAADPIVEVTPMSDKPIGNHLWGYIVEVKPGVTEGATKLFARTAADAPGKPAGTDHATALTVTILPRQPPQAFRSQSMEGRRQTLREQGLLMSVIVRDSTGLPRSPTFLLPSSGKLLERGVRSAREPASTRRLKDGAGNYHPTRTTAEATCNSPILPVTLAIHVPRWT